MQDLNDFHLRETRLPHWALSRCWELPNLRTEEGDGHNAGFTSSFHPLQEKNKQTKNSD